MNAYDAERMADVLAPEGFGEAATMEEADLIVLNTCHIREKAAEKVYSELGRVRALKRERERDGRGTTVVVAGCVAQAEGQEIIRRAPVVDVVVGPQSYHRLPELLRRAGHWARHRRYGVSARGQVRAPAGAVAGEDAQPRRLGLPHGPGGLRQVLHLLRRPLHAGRGKLAPRRGDRRRGGTPRCGRHSRGHAHRPERQRLSRRSGPAAPCGRSAASCTGSPTSPASRACATPRAIRATWTTTLIAAHRDLPALMPYLHLPVQAGSDRILAAMNRRHGSDTYLRLDRADTRGPARHRAVVRFHRRLPGRGRGRFPGHLAPRRRGALRQRLLVQIQPAPGHAGGRARRSGAGGGEGGAPRPPAGTPREPPPGLQPGDLRPDRRGSPREAGPPSGPACRQVALSAGRASRG